jgi:hypothetical protein
VRAFSPSTIPKRAANVKAITKRVWNNGNAVATGLASFGLAQDRLRYDLRSTQGASSGEANRNQLPKVPGTLFFHTLTKRVSIELVSASALASIPRPRSPFDMPRHLLRVEPSDGPGPVSPRSTPDPLLVSEGNGIIPDITGAGEVVAR